MVSYKCLKWYYYIIEEKQRQLTLWVVFFQYQKGVDGKWDDRETNEVCR